MAEQDIAHRIKELRKANGMTFEQVAEIVGVGKSTVRKWETGLIANMRRDKIAALAKALHTTPEYLMGWSDSQSSSPSCESERIMIAGFRKLNIKGQELVLDYIDVLNRSGAYAAVADDLRSITVMPTTKKITAAARSGDRMEVPAISPEEEDAALPPPYTGDI